MKKLYQIFLLLSPGKQIALSVCLIHLVVLFALTFHHLISSKLQRPRQMLVQTIALQQKETPTAKPKPVPKPKEVVAAKPKPVPKPTPAKEKQVDETLLKEIKNSFATLSSEPKQAPKQTLNVPTKIPAKTQPVTEKIDDDPSYGEYLIAYLQKMLDLPEYGEVKMEIEIDASGKLVQCQVLESKNRKNAEFLKGELALLSYPIPHFDPKQNSKKFSVVFRNR